MRKYYDTVLVTDTGRPLPGAVIVVKQSGVPVTIYSDADGLIEIDTLTTDANGYFEFYVPDGEYAVQYTYGGSALRDIPDVQIFDIAVQKAKLDTFIKLSDYVTEANATNPSSVHTGLTQAINDAVSRGIREIVLDARVYAQPSSDITLNNITLTAADLARPPYLSGNYATTIQQTDQTRPIFRVGKNVTLRGLNLVNPALTDAAAQTAITNAGAVTPSQKKAALDAIWGATSPLLIGQAGDNMSTINLIDICVPKCWYFMRVGNTPQYEVAGAINLVRPRIFSVARDFIGKSSAEVNNVVGGIFGWNVNPDEFAAPASSPLRDYCVDYGAFLEVDSAASNYNSFDGFNVFDTVIWGKQWGLLCTSGVFSVSRWRGIHMDAVSRAIDVTAAGRILHTSFVIDAYSYRFPSGNPDTSASSRSVIVVSATAAASTGDSRFSVKLKSDYSAGPVAVISGDQEVHIDFDSLAALDFGAKETTGIAAVNMGNTNANSVIRLPDARLRAPSGNTIHSGILVANGRVEGGDVKFERCKYAASVTGGSLILASPVSTGTVVADLVQSGGTLDVRNPVWSKPQGFAGYPSFKAFGGAQTFSTAGPTVKTFATESFDQHGDFASNTFTVPFDGEYDFACCLLHDATGTAGDRWAVDICKNGTAALRISYKMIADSNSIDVSGVVGCVAGDTVDVRLTRVSGSGNFVISADNAANFFSGRKVC